MNVTVINANCGGFESTLVVLIRSHSITLMIVFLVRGLGRKALTRALLDFNHGNSSLSNDTYTISHTKPEDRELETGSPFLSFESV